MVGVFVLKQIKGKIGLLLTISIIIVPLVETVMQLQIILHCIVLNAVGAGEQTPNMWNLFLWEIINNENTYFC